MKSVEFSIALIRGRNVRKNSRSTLYVKEFTEMLRYRIAFCEKENIVSRS